METEPKKCTVAELIEALRHHDPNAIVWLEGCDCHGLADGSVEKETVDGVATVLLTRRAP